MAKCGVTNVAGGGGIGSDELSVTKEYVLIGKKYVGADTDDEIGIGIMVDNRTTANQNLNAGGSFLVKNGYHAQPFTVIANSLASQTPATATDNRVMSGDTYWRNGVKGTGTMTVQSILSFSVAPYTENQIIFTWKNPAMGPYSGVIIVGKTGAYPTSITDGTRYYKGFGNNSSANGTSNITLSGFSPNVTYYFRAYSYTTLNGSEWVHSNSLAANAMIKLTILTFTSSQTWTVPSGINQVKVFCVGGGGAGGDGSWETRGGVTGNGGGGGYTVTQTVNVTPGQQIPVIIGSGGDSYYGLSDSRQRNGSQTSFGSVVAKGGYGGIGDRAKHLIPEGNETPEQLEKSIYTFSDGGSGGGAGGAFEPDTRDHLYGVPWGANGGTNGSNGGVSGLYNIVYTGEDTESGGRIYTYGDVMREAVGEGGRGQGTTTRAFGEGTGTVYSGGGGGAGGGKIYFTANGTAHRYEGAGGGGGASGGGRGGTGNSYQDSAMNGVAGTGGGGGGGGGRGNSGASRYSGGGGSGICIIRYLG